jgi:2-phosphoglycerate kinase
MATPEEEERLSATPAPERPRTFVEDPGGRRPFMRGIMIHSLLARGISFEDAFRTANDVRERVRGRPVVTREDLAKSVREILGEAAVTEEGRARPGRAAILVVGHGRKLPFSKGILSQSLLAAAIEPNDAFDVAREIEEQLQAHGVREIERGELRRIAFETLRKRIGPRIAERYLVWRRYQEPDRPVILLLGGATGAGKTSLGLEVAHRLGIHRVLSTDSIRQIMRIMLSADLVPAIHRSSYEAGAPAAAPGEDPVIEGFRAQAATVSVGVRAMMDRAVAESSSMILDGVSIVPGMIDLMAYEHTAHVIFLVVATLSPEAYRSRFAARERDEIHRPQHRYAEHLDPILRIQEHFLELADRYNIPIVDNDNFDRSVLSIVRHVTESLRKKVPFDVAELL